jgi:hypothetical protein
LKLRRLTAMPANSDHLKIYELMNDAGTRNSP